MELRSISLVDLWYNLAFYMLKAIKYLGEVFLSYQKEYIARLKG